MKPFTFLLLTICFFISSANAQSPVEYGITGEGSLFMPQSYFQDSPKDQYTFGLGFGVYASKNIVNKFSADLGFTYRLNDLREYFPKPYYNYGGYNYGYGGYGYDPGAMYNYGVIKDDWQTYILRYIVLPLHINYHLDPIFFICGGIEACWLTNYEALGDQTTFNWTIGLGYGKNKLKGSLNYIQGFKAVKFANEQVMFFDERSSSIYRNRMIQLNLSCLIFQKK